MGSLANYIATIAGSILIARALSPDSLGEISYLVWVLSVISSLLPLGIPFAATIRLGVCAGRGEESKARAVYLIGLKTTMLLTMLGIVVCLTTRSYWTTTQLLAPWSTASVIVLIAAPPVVSALEGWASAGLDYRPVAVGNLFASVGFVSAASVAFALHSVDMVFAAYALRAIIQLFWWILHMAPRIWAFLRSRVADSAPSTVESLWPLALEHWTTMAGRTLVWSRSELAFLNWLADSAEMAQFNIASQVSSPIQMMTTLFTAPLSLFTARLNSPDGRTELVEKLGQIIRLSCVASGLAALAMSSVAPVLVPLLFGTAYAPAGKLVPYLVFAAWVYAQLSILSALSQGVQRPRYILASMVGGGIAMLAFGVPLTSWYGATGGAISRALTQLASLLALLTLINRDIPGILDKARLLPSVALFGLSLFALAGIILLVEGVFAVGAGVLLLLVVALMVRRLRILCPEDVITLELQLCRLPKPAKRLVSQILMWVANTPQI